MNVFKVKFQTTTTKYSNRWTSNTLILLVEVLAGSYLWWDFSEVLIHWVMNFPFHLLSSFYYWWENPHFLLMTLFFFFIYLQSKRAESLKSESLQTILKLMETISKMNKRFALISTMNSWLINAFQGIMEFYHKTLFLNMNKLDVNGSS